MSYQITDTGASIRFVNDDGFFYLMKHDIKSISAIRDELLKIETGGCLHNLFINVGHVTEPAHTGPDNLANIMNLWITEFMRPPVPEDPDSGPR